MPGRELQGSTRKPPLRTPEGREILWFVDADIRVPEINIPPIPMRAATGRICHPTGRWRALLFKEQVELLEDCGGSIEKTHWYYSFEVNRDLESFGRDLFERKAASMDASGHPTPMTALLKYCLNGGGFGKFAECPDRMQLVIGRIPDRFLYTKEGEPLASAEDIRIIAPSVSLVPSFRPAPHEHVPMACITGGRSMTRLIRDMQLYEAHGSIILYADTDGFDGTLALDGYTPKLGAGLGEYKVEYPQIVSGTFAGPKLYCLKDASLQKTVVRAKAFPTAKYGELVPGSRKKRKGFCIASDETRPLSAVMTYEKVCQIVEDWPWDADPIRETESTVRVEFERMRRIPETLKGYKATGDMRPGSVWISKEPKAPRPSRCFDRSGFSRPWTVKEVNP